MKRGIVLEDNNKQPPEPPSEDEGKKTKGNKPLGRPKGPPKIDPQYKKKYDECVTALVTLEDTLGDLLSPEVQKKAIQKKFDKDGRVDMNESGADGILKFLDEDRDRMDQLIGEDHQKFDAKLNEYKKASTFTSKEDGYLSSLRNADMARLVEHEQFLEVCQLGIKYYKNLFASEKSVEAKRDQLIRASIREMKDEQNARMKDTNQYASAQSQAVDDAMLLEDGNA